MKDIFSIFPVPASFKRQIVLTYVVGFFFLCAAFVAYLVQFESDFLYRDSNDRTTALARSLAVSARSWVLADDVVGLQEVVNSVRDYPGLRYAMVISPTGRVLAHTDASKSGQFVTDAQSRTLIGAQPANRVMRDAPSFIDIAVPIVVNERLVGWARIGHERDFVTANLSKMIWRSAFFILISTALALFAAFLIARRLGYRIGSLVRVAEQVQAGNFSTRAHISERPDEITKLADSFNRMLDALAQNRKELRGASHYTRSLIEASLDPLVTISAQGKITDVNKATEQVTGRSRAELIGTDFSDYFTEPDKAREGYQQVFQNSFVTDYPLAIRHKDGHITDVLYNASVYRNKAGEVSGVFAAARDITGRKLTEEALRENERFLDAIVEHVPNMLFVKDAKELRFVRFNKAGEQLLGYSRLDLIGKNDYDFFPKEQADFFVSKDRAIIASGKLMDIAEEPISTRLSGQRFLHTRKLPIYADDGSPRYLLGISEDITEHKQEEERLRRSEHSLSEAQRIAHLGSWELDLASNVLTWSDEIYRIFDIDPKKFGASYDAFLDAIHPEDRDMVNKAYTDSLASKTPYDIVHRLLMKDGRIKFVNEKCETHYGEDGKPLRSVGTVHDITERKRAEEALQERERHSQSLLRLSRNLERSQSYSEVLTAARDEVRNIIGYRNLWVYLFTEDKLYAKALMADGPISDTVMSEEGTATLCIKGDRMLEEIAQAKEIVLVEDALTDERVNKEIATRMGLRTIVNVPIILFDRHMGSVGTGTMGDEGVRVPSVSEQGFLMALASHMAAAIDRIHLLAERRKVEMELRELNNDFVTLLENSGDFIYFKDKDSRFRFCSQTLANITGHHSWRDMIGKNDLEVFPEKTARIYYEEELPIFQKGKPLLNKTDPYLDELGRPGWVSTNKWPVFGEDKKTVVGIFGISRDITELKEAEDEINELNRDLERRVDERTAQLEAANKELEAFSYSVSHDLRTPLRAIDGFSRILLDEYRDKLDEEGRRLLGVVRSNTNRMSQLIDDILRFSRTGRVAMNVVEVDMAQQAREVIAELVPDGDSGKLQLEIEHLPPAECDGAMMRQVFVNLLSNAIKFSAKCDAPRIKVGSYSEGDEIIYYVKDNGAGFDMQYADKLFGVFQRLHSIEEFDGTGIGLAIVKRIITRHGGRVWAEGKVNEGATVYFALPIKETDHG